ncbi:MAG: hypothetical protein A2Z25_03770 [Planctomycetes bacterium RBG_16_55_9]|nr:MAG: hypothetical protein A2Z25_03770 [Planctomycetes bacterium RBG_16_55_9]
MKDIAPSDELRKGFAHKPERWTEFKKRYLQELSDNKNVLEDLKNLARINKRITLLFGAKNQEQNNAVVLREALAKTNEEGRRIVQVELRSDGSCFQAPAAGGKRD